jgi:hypothetical protein
VVAGRTFEVLGRRIGQYDHDAQLGQKLLFDGLWYAPKDAPAAGDSLNAGRIPAFSGARLLNGHARACSRVSAAGEWKLVPFVLKQAVQNDRS